MKAKNLIYCPHCEENGKRNVLGSLNDSNEIVILKLKGITKITGDDFALTCGSCGNKVYYRRKENGNN